MTVDEAKHKMDFLKKAYQKLIDEKVDSGKLIGDGVMGEWKAETPLDEAYKDMIEALEMAIKALEQQPSEDCISREAVENITWEEPSYTDALNVLTEVREKIRQLPSVTPKAEPCEDCISRQATIDAIYKKYIGGKDAIENVLINDLYVCGLEEVVDVVKNMPPVTPWSGWIPVSEKLPEPLTAVLLTVRYKSTGILTYQMGYWEDALEKWEKWLEIGTLDDEFEILAWMELPEKYEEDNNE